MMPQGAGETGTGAHWRLPHGAAKSRARITAALLFIGFMLAAPRARAAGFYLAPPGAMPLAQGGAVVASGAGAMTVVYNPAGLASTVDQLSLDIGLPLYRSRVVRRGPAPSPSLQPVSGRPLGLPNPNGGIVWRLGGPRLPVLGFAVTTDYPTLQRWPDARVLPTTPQRYATGGFAGTALGRGILGAGWAPYPWLQVGAGFQLLAGRLATASTLSTCDGVICTQPENPEYDATASLRTRFFAISGASAGVVLRPAPWLHVAASWTSGFSLNSRADVRLTLPRAPLYAAATLSPEHPSARLAMRLPGVVRAGVALKLRPHWHVAADVSWTPWHVHRQLGITQADVVVGNLPAIGQFRVAGLSVPRNFVDAVAVHVGGSYAHVLSGNTLTYRIGALRDPSAVPARTLSAMTVDLPKLMLSCGVAWRRGRVEVQATAAQIWMGARDVAHSAVHQLNPTQLPNSSKTTVVGNGRYTGGAQIVALGLNFFR